MCVGGYEFYALKANGQTLALDNRRMDFADSRIPQTPTIGLLRSDDMSKPQISALWDASGGFIIALLISGWRSAVLQMMSTGGYR